MTTRTTYIRWFVVAQGKKTRVPQWARSAGILPDGTIIIPAALGGNEKLVTLSAAHDGVPLCLSDNHIYLPIDWMATEFPAQRAIWERITERVRQAATMMREGAH